ELVRAVVPGQAAARAGLQQGDVILRVGGEMVTPDETVSFLIANSTVGARVPVDIIRSGRRQTVTVVVGQRPTEEQLALQAGGDIDGAPGGAFTRPGAGTQAIGLTLVPLSPELARRSNLPAGARGVVISAVEPGSDAAEKGLRAGFLIMSVNQVAITSPAEVAAAVEAARRAGRRSILLLVKSGATPEAFVGIDIGAR
ncbi:MAG: PDZ domain-containing protein, partial [Sphingomonas bacterium]|nr:PDZ domain-containing protein [Sphingomonas bacterium]